MRILLTNDDGIHAPGLKTLEAIARTLSDDIYIVAPETDQSGVAHALSLNDPLRLRKVSDRHYAVKGTPTDCVIMALRHLMSEQKPDLVLSGVNRGHNIAEDVTYSGTVAAAIEGTLLGVRSIALSQAYGFETTRQTIRWHTAEKLAPGILKTLIAQKFPDNTLLNVNFPDCEPEQVGDVQLTRQGRRNQGSLKIDERMDGRGNPYYWLAFQKQRQNPKPDTDLWALNNSNVSVTPLSLDLTADGFLDDLRSAGLSLG
ncbi:MAG: 5'/3'-nucleotidase SurE [Pseudomonadota bacterium]